MTELTTLQKALYTIKKLKQLLDEQEKKRQPIAIVGLSCRFPQAANKEAYWQLLSRGESAISAIPEQRWELLKGTQEEVLRDKTYQYWGSYLSDIDAFDAYFFGISPREATLMDPQQRWLLEVVYEAIEDAGLPLETLAGSNTGVFAGLDSSQFIHLQELDTDLDALYLPTGNATSIAANRISYVFDLHGPSMVIDTACSASLVAAHLACLNLQNNLCDLALVCTANINFLPMINLILSKATMLSLTGKCKTFDAEADGYIQGEGIGALVLKPLDKAIKDKDRIYAVIEGSAVNQDGATNGLTAPNGLQQERLIKSVYSAAHIDPQKISYVECHGTGTFLGDPIEVEALGEAISHNRTKENPCWIGSVKANIGHLEPAAGIASLIKVVLGLQHQKIFPQVNFATPNPYIDFNKYHFRVPTQLEAWPQYGSLRIAGISGFGFGGTNAHLVVREMSSEEKSNHVVVNTPQAELFTLSAKNPAALKALIERWRAYLAGNLSLDIAQLCYNLHVRRTHYASRVAIIAQSIEQVYNTLCLLHDDLSACPENVFMSEPGANSLKNVPFDFNRVEDLSALATHYIHQGKIDWHRYESQRSYPHCDMPLYPWQHKRYWPEATHRRNLQEDISVDAYPLQGKQIASPLSEIQFSFEFDHKTLPEIRDTYSIIHAGYYLEMLAFAAKQLRGKNEFTIEDLVFLSPLIVPDNMTLNVQLVIEKTHNEEMHFTFYSYQQGQMHWIKHAEGILLLTVSSNKKVDPIAVIEQRCFKEEQDADLFYQRLTHMGLPTGKSIRWSHHCWLGENEILCEFRQPEIKHANEQFALQIHPGIIDASIQPVFMLLPSDMNKPFIAERVGRIHYSMKKSEKFYLLASLKEISPGGKKIFVDWCLINQDDQVVAESENICLTQIDNKIDDSAMKLIREGERLDLSHLSKSEQEVQVIDYLINQIAIIFSMPKEDIDTSQSLHEMGVDSLMALVLMRTIETGLGITYSVQNILQGPSIVEIAKYVISHYQLNQTEVIESDKINTEEKINPWITYRQPQKNAKIRLFCFPYGGGGASIYREWQEGLPDSIEVCPVQLPGREERMNEAPVGDIDTLVYSLIKYLQPQFDLPFAFFGHSFGSLIAFALTRYLRQNSLALPKHLFVSAYPDPSIPSKSLDKLLQQLSEMHLPPLESQSIPLFNDEQIMKLAAVFNENGVFDYGGHLLTPEIMRILLPVFIEDMHIVKSYFYRDESPLDMPITVFLGERDMWVSHADHLGWAAHTYKRCEVHEFDSGHLFIRDSKCRKEMLQIIAKNLVLGAEMGVSELVD